MKSTVLAVLLAILVGLAVHTAKAGTISADPCYGCTNETAWIANAQSYGWGATGYLYSFEGRQIRRFRNSGQIAGTDPTTASVGDASKAGGTVQSPTQPDVTWLPVDTKYANYFNTMVRVRDLTGTPLSALRINYNLPANAVDSHGNLIGAYNAYDIVNSSAANNNLEDYLYERRLDVIGRSELTNLVNELMNLLQNLDKVVTKGELLKLTIVVVFTDGSEMQFTDTGNGSINRVKGSGRDKKNNSILDANSIDGRGSYWIDASDVNGFTNNMEHIGVDIPGPGSGYGPRVYDCVWNPTKSTLTCRLVSN